MHACGCGFVLWVWADHISRMQRCILADMCLCAEGAISVFSCVQPRSSYFINDVMTCLTVVMCMSTYTWMSLDIHRSEEAAMHFTACDIHIGQYARVLVIQYMCVDSQWAPPSDFGGAADTEQLQFKERFLRRCPSVLSHWRIGNMAHAEQTSLTSAQHLPPHTWSDSYYTWLQHTMDWTTFNSSISRPYVYPIGEMSTLTKGITKDTDLQICVKTNTPSQPCKGGSGNLCLSGQFLRCAKK